MTTTTETKAETRQERGLALFRDHASQVAEVAPGVFRVPSCTTSATYTVDLERCRCSCPDRTFRGAECKHIIAAIIADAKRRCRERRTRRTGHRHGPPRERREGISEDRHDHRRGSTPNRQDESLRGLVTDPERLAELASRMGV